MNLLYLNDDVLAVILSLLHAGDAFALAKTCRLAHLLALPWALSEVIVDTPRSFDPCMRRAMDPLAVFCVYMLEDPLTRLVHLRKLHIRCERWHSTVDPDNAIQPGEVSGASLLPDLLTNAPQLRSLVLDDLQFMLSAQPRLFGAIAALPQLQHVRFFSSKHCLGLLSSLTSRPRCVEVFTMWHDFEVDYDAIQIPSQLLESVEVLSLTGCAALAKRTKTVWPSVHTLALCGTLHSPSALAETFPNARSVVFHTMYGSNNILASPRWQSLDYLRLDHQQHVSFPVRRLELCSALGDHNQDFLTALLRDASPVVLSVRVLKLGSACAILHAIAEAGSSVRVLKLTVSRGEENGLLQDTFMPLRALPLVALWLHIETVRRTDIDCQRDAIAAAIPTLRFVATGLRENPYSSATNSVFNELEPESYFRACAGKGGRLERLEELEGHMMHQQMLRMGRS